MNYTFYREHLLFNETLEKNTLTIACKQITKKIPDLHNTKEYFQSILKTENQ